MSLTAAETSTRADASAFTALIEPWTSACVARDWGALLAMCTDDVGFSPPNEPLVEGSAAVRSFLETFPTIKAMAWDIDHLESAGDLAWLRGWVRMTLDVSGQSVDFNGKYADVCRRSPDGAWRFAFVMWSSNEAAPGGPA